MIEGFFWFLWFAAIFTFIALITERGIEAWLNRPGRVNRALKKWIMEE